MPEIKLMSTGVPNLDAVLGGGIPVYSLNILAGSPGSGKTILAQQILFNSIRNQPDAKGIYLSTLSEPSVKVVRYMQYFDFFDGAAFGEQVIYRDLGGFLYEQPLARMAEQIVALVSQYPLKPFTTSPKI
jgi:circadian clock protein KaiC